jgi:hypothetical protein
MFWCDQRIFDTTKNKQYQYYGNYRPKKEPGMRFELTSAGDDPYIRRNERQMLDNDQNTAGNRNFDVRSRRKQL